MPLQLSWPRTLRRQVVLLLEWLRRDVVCGGGFTRDGAYDFVWDSVRPMTGNYFFNYFQYQEFVECVCMLNDWISCNDDVCADNYNFPVQVARQVSQ